MTKNFLWLQFSLCVCVYVSVCVCECVFSFLCLHKNGTGQDDFLLLLDMMKVFGFSGVVSPPHTTDVFCQFFSFETYLSLVFVCVCFVCLWYLLLFCVWSSLSLMILLKKKSVRIVYSQENETLVVWSGARTPPRPPGFGPEDNHLSFLGSCGARTPLLWSTPPPPASG